MLPGRAEEVGVESLGTGRLGDSETRAQFLNWGMIAASCMRHSLEASMEANEVVPVAAWGAAGERGRGGLGKHVFASCLS